MFGYSARSYRALVRSDQGWTRNTTFRMFFNLELLTVYTASRKISEKQGVFTDKKGNQEFYFNFKSLLTSDVVDLLQIGIHAQPQIR